MKKRITIRLSTEAKEKIMERSSWVSSDISHILRGFIAFINNLPETEAATFLTMLREFKAYTEEQEKTVTDLTLRG